jgi:hypothetical protein
MQTVYIANDGRKFATAEECTRYEQYEGSRQTIAKWAKTRYSNAQGQSTRAVNFVSDWEMDREAVMNGTFTFAPETVKQDEPAVQEAA